MNPSESIISSNIFNMTNTEANVPWRSLTNEKRVELVNKFFETEFNTTSRKKVDNNTIYMITELALHGKLKLKKEITYDKVNERIIEIHGLVSEHTDFYEYKPELLIKKEKSKKIAKNVLFRKK